MKEGFDPAAVKKRRAEERRARERSERRDDLFPDD
jgi:hypothetical protein